MEWAVNTSDEFDQWFGDLDDDVRRRLAPKIERLELHGPTLGYPESSDINDSRHGGMRELRPQIDGRPYRILYAFDPNREALLILAGDKTSDDDWYDRNVPIADAIFDRHLAKIAKEREEKAKQEAEQAKKAKKKKGGR